MKISQFNKGWWNCFETFAAEVLFFNPSTGPQICKNVLKSAGITAEEAEAWLDQDEGNKPELSVVVRDYMVNTH